MNEQRVLDAVERVALRQGDRHSLVWINEIPTALDPSRERNDPETHMLITRLIDQGRLVVEAPGKVALGIGLATRKGAKNGC